MCRFPSWASEGRCAFPFQGVSVEMAANCSAVTEAVAVQVASSSTTDFLNFLKRKHHHSFHKDVDFFVLLALFVVLLGVLQKQAVATCARIYMRRWVHDSNTCWCCSEAPTVRCCCSSRVCCCSVVLVRTLRHCSVPNVKPLYTQGTLTVSTPTSWPILMPG